MLGTRRRATWLLVLAVVVIAPAAHAQEKVSTCIEVEAPAGERDGLARLVASEVDRHPSHRSATGGCAVHLHIELIAVDGGRFLTGRVGGEVPDRERVDGTDAKALEHALGDLLRTVLGNDPVSLHAPEGRSWFSEHVLSLKDRGRNTFDVAPIETMSPIPGKLVFAPGALLGFSREIDAWQVGIEALFAQNLHRADGRLDLGTELRLQATLTLYFGGEGDTSAYAGASVGFAYEHFSGPRGKDLGGGPGVYDAAIPGLGLRAGVEIFRTTSMRANLFAEAFIPVLPVNDVENEVVSGWIPTIALGAGARF